MGADRARSRIKRLRGFSRPQLARGANASVYGRSTSPLGLMNTAVRPALASDAPSLAAIKAATFPPKAVTDEPKTQSDLGFKPYTELIENHRGLVYVAETNGSVVGFLALQHEGHPAVVGRNPLKLWQLYVAPALHGSDVASQLMSATMDHARTHLHDVVWLGVSEHNARGRAFYRKHGFKPLGVHQVRAGGHAHQDIVMSCLVHSDGGSK